MNYQIACMFSAFTRHQEAKFAVKRAEEHAAQCQREVNDSLDLMTAKLRAIMAGGWYQHKVQVYNSLDRDQLLFYVWLERKEPKKNRPQADVLTLAPLDMNALNYLRDHLVKLGFKMEDQKITESSVQQWVSIDVLEGKYD